jgi:hypothetical protein
MTLFIYQRAAAVVGCSLLGVSGVWGDDANKNLLLLLLPLEGHNSGTKVNGIG